MRMFIHEETFSPRTGEKCCRLKRKAGSSVPVKTQTRTWTTQPVTYVTGWRLCLCLKSNTVKGRVTCEVGYFCLVKANFSSQWNILWNWNTASNTGIFFLSKLLIVHCKAKNAEEGNGCYWLSCDSYVNNCVAQRRGLNSGLIWGLPLCVPLTFNQNLNVLFRHHFNFTLTRFAQGSNLILMCKLVTFGLVPRVMDRCREHPTS